VKVKLAVAFAVLFFASAAHADSSWVYTYTGNALDSAGTMPNCHCAADGSFTLDAPLGDSESFAPSSFSFDVDGYAFNQSNSNGSLSVTTNATGQIVYWDLSVYHKNDFNINLISDFDGNLDYAMDVFGFGTGPYDSYYRLSDPGTWTTADPQTAPEPSSLLLSGLGLAALIGLARRNRTNSQNRWSRP